jgi:hypothetical protein
MAAPKNPCPRCGGSWWHLALVGEIEHSCVTCGYVAYRVHRDVRLREDLMAEASLKSKSSGGDRRSAAYRQQMRERDERNLRVLRELSGVAS